MYEETAKISVIVPIYRVEKYLEKCIDSLLAQTLEDMELVLVDDGSPDRSGQIADRYAAIYSNIKVIHQKNAGLGPARNSGIAAATGAYVGFVDADDWVRPDMYRRLYETAKQHDADIVVSGRCDVAGETVLAVKAHPLAGQVLRSEQEIQAVRKRLFGHAPDDTETVAFPMSVCMSLYRKSFLEAFQLRFHEIFSEDTIFNLSAYQYARTLCFIGDTEYCYRKEQQASITETFSDRTIMRYVQFFEELARIARQEEPECILRAKRTVIDCCRTYVGAVNRSKLPFIRKMAAVRSFARHPQIMNLWEGYPVKTLPVKQRIFQWMVLGEQYAAVLMLDRMRNRRKWKNK